MVVFDSLNLAKVGHLDVLLAFGVGYRDTLR